MLKSRLAIVEENTLTYFLDNNELQGKIGAIKAVKERCGVGLKEAKDFVELAAQMPHDYANYKGFCVVATTQRVFQWDGHTVSRGQAIDNLINAGFSSSPMNASSLLDTLIDLVVEEWMA